MEHHNHQHLKQRLLIFDGTSESANNILNIIHQNGISIKKYIYTINVKKRNEIHPILHDYVKTRIRNIHDLILPFFYENLIPDNIFNTFIDYYYDCVDDLKIEDYLPVIRFVLLAELLENTSFIIKIIMNHYNITNINFQELMITRQPYYTDPYETLEENETICKFCRQLTNVCKCSTETFYCEKCKFKITYLKKHSFDFIKNHKCIFCTECNKYIEINNFNNNHKCNNKL